LQLDPDRSPATGDANAAISRAYYAMFDAAEAALLQKGVEASTHAGVLAMFGDRLVKTREVAPEHGRNLKRAFQKRQVSDYDVLHDATRQEAEGVLDDAGAFVRALRDLLKAGT
jgi:uncharacterized protein (UPF0332 family)